MNKQEIAALLEVISFFFVGLDLYGKERLGKMQANILELSDKLYTRLTNANDFEWNKQRRSRFMKTVYLITGAVEVGCIIYNLIESGNPFKDFSFQFSQILWYLLWSILIAAGLFLTFGFIMLPILLGIVAIIVLIIIAIQIVNIFLRILIWAFRFYRIEGVFLFIGTLLFIVSKYWQLY
jgi:hypothetical protein